MKQKFQKFFAVMLVVVMTATLFTMPLAAAPAESVEATEVLEARTGRAEASSQYMESVTPDDVAHLLYPTVQPPVGMVGFEGPYCIDGYTNEIVGITVMFRTPPAVALRLIEEAANPRARMGGRAADSMFVGEALAAHNAFSNQLAVLPVPFAATQGIEVVGYHYMLFNGVFLNVPASMVATIAALPEVFAVMPSVVYFSMYELANMSYEQMMARERLPVAEEDAVALADAMAVTDVVVESGATKNVAVTVDAPAGAIVISNANLVEDYITVTHSSLVGADGRIDVVVSAVCAEGYDSPLGDYSVVLAAVFFSGGVFVTEQVTLDVSVVEPYVPGPYVRHPEFNRGAIDLFNIPYIHETIGVTGRGVRVGVLDTGVDYRHPVFAPYLVPTYRYMPGVGYYTLRGANFTNIAGRPTGRGTSPMEGNVGTTHTNHGTHVAGTIIAMAPDIELYAFRVLASGVGSQPANSVTRALEYAYYLDLDVVNLSLGNRLNTPWQSTSYAISLLDLAGIVSTNSAGNDLAGGTVRAVGRGGWFSTGGGASASPLGITVGAGEAGGRDLFASVGAHIDGYDAEINLIGAAAGDWSIEDMGYDFDYVWFGMITLPPGGRTNPVAFAAFVAEVRELLDGGDLEGKVAIINRGGGEFVTMMDMAHELGAVALIVVNNQADESHLSGTVLNNDGQPIPAYSMRRYAGLELLGPPTPTPNPPVRGTVNFGVVERTPTPDTLATFSSAGPIGPITGALPATMCIGVDIVAPGVNVLSANNVQHASRIDGRPYVLMGGTSMSAPAVAGIVALMIERYPNANPNEIRSRIMSTARPLTGYEGQYSVLQVGAGFIDPVRALSGGPFITTRHAAPFCVDTGRWGAPDMGQDIGLVGGWSYLYMSSLSFGRVDMEYGVPARTVTIPVTIQRSAVGSGWTVEYSLNMPTQALLPPDGNWNLWGPPLTHTVSGVTVEIQQITSHQFAVHLTHDGNFENRGFAEGYLTFTQGDVVLTTPFGAYFDIEPLPVPLEPNPNSVIWRPILSNWITTPYNYGEADPRAFSLVHPGAAWFFPEDVGIITRSNFSSLDFGFIDPNNGPARPLRFYFAPYGYGVEDATLFSTAAPLAPGAFTTYVNAVRSVKGGMTYTVNAAQGIHVIWEWNEGDATVLDPGVYTLFVRVVHGAGEEYDLVQGFNFVVTDERPSVELYAETFYFEEGDEYVTVTGSVSSLGHDLAMYHDLVFRPVAGTIDAPFDYTRVQLQLVTAAGTFVVPVNADGTFSFELDAEEADYTMRVIDGVGQVILPVMFGNLILGWSANPASNMISYFTSFSVALAEEDEPTVHTVTFVVEAGAVGVYAAVTTTVEVYDGDLIPADAIPSTVARAGFYFVEWYPSDPAEHGYVTEDVTFTARFNLLWHYVTFEAGDGGQLVAAEGFGLAVRIRDGFTFWADRVPTPVANDGYEFVKWYPVDPAGFVVLEDVTFTAVFAEAAPAVPQIVSVSPTVVEPGGTVELIVITQGMPDGAWVDLNVAWRPGLSVVGGPRFYVTDNKAVITVAAAADASVGRDGFSVTARAAGDWGIPFVIDSYAIVIEVR